jgi:surface polysaccharide O-acyltransferase-like enzyme
VSEVVQDGAKGWIPEINLLRGFAIIAVIIIHVTVNFMWIGSLTPLSYTNLVIDAFAHFAVPLFIIISGVVLARNHWAGTKWLKFYQGRFVLILVPYAIFSIIYLIYSYATAGSAITVLGAVEALVCGTAAYHLWFVPLIVELYLLYPLFTKAYVAFESRGRIAQLLLACFAAQVIFSVAFNIMPTGGLAMQMLTNSFLGYIFYFVLGMYVGRNFGSVMRRVNSLSTFSVSLVAIVSGLVASTYIVRGDYNIPSEMPLVISSLIWQLAVPVLTVCATILLYRLSAMLLARASRVGSFIDDLGTYSFGIYLVHLLFLNVLVTVMDGALGITYNDAVFYPLLFLLTVAASLIFVRLVVKLPHGNMVVGLKPRKPGVPKSPIPSNVIHR